jgi:hypothetical protein
MIETMTTTEKLLERARQQSTFVKRLHSVSQNDKNQAKAFRTQLALERAKLAGMIDMLDACGIDRSEFSWIYLI